MSFSSGTKLGRYEILASMGAGGMGEVYKAKDTRLDRTVAIKVLPSHLSDNPHLRERFEREARAVSQLNHPHICTLYDVGEQDGVDFLVMEYIEGETLAERLNRGALKLDQALEYGIQIADGLDNAHRAGIVHRDLKPANVMLTKSGVKLLDFGLAKHAHSEISTDSKLPTQQKDLTQEGSLVGTLQYMAPEQLEAKNVDARSDIFAFGAVLYEMVTGQKAFRGDSQASLIAAILEHEPPAMTALAHHVPPPIERLVRKCLAKEPGARWQSAADLADDLRWLVADSSPSADMVPKLRATSARQFAWMWVVLAAGLFGILGLVGWWLWIRDRPVPIDPGDVQHTQLTFSGDILEAALSPDGRTLAYAVGTQDDTLAPAVA